MRDPDVPELGEQEVEHPLVGYRSNAEWQDLISQTGALINAIDSIDDEATRKSVFDALAGIDAIHREALHRLVRLFKEGVLEQVITDPAINTLMGMYDLLPEAEPACQKVWDFIKEDGEGSSVSAQPAGAPPHWSPAPVPQEPSEDEALVCQMEEGTFVLVNADGQFYAFSAQCPVHEASMVQGRREKLSWICPHGPGCVYDVRNGARLGGGPALECVPVKTNEAGRILLGFGIPYEPSMPAF